MNLSVKFASKYRFNICHTVTTVNQKNLLQIVFLSVKSIFLLFFSQRKDMKKKGNNYNNASLAVKIYMIIMTSAVIMDSKTLLNISTYDIFLSGLDFTS